MAALCSRLVASMRELLDGYEAVLERTSASTAQAAPAAPREVALTAGPFRDIGALRGFEEAVSNLPGVRDVAVRGYEGNDRAILDVRLIG